MITRRVSPTFLLVVGLVCVSVGVGLLAFHRTVTDEQTIMREAEPLAKSEPVREEFGGRLAAELTLPNAAPDPAALNRINDTAAAAVRTPEFQEAFRLALPALYERLVKGASAGDIVLDPALVDAAVRKAGAEPPAGLTLTAKADDIPDLHGLLDLIERFAGALAVLGLVSVLVGVALSPHRGRAVMRIGRWMITVGVLAIIAFWAVPTLALLPLGGWVSVIGIVLATADWLAVPAAVIAAIGITIVVIGRAGEQEERRRELSVIPKAPSRRPTSPGFQ